MLVLKGKFYYVAPVYPIVFAAGAVGLELWTRGAEAAMGFRRCMRCWCWAVGAVLAPLAIPLLPEQTYIAYTQKIGIQAAKV